jgi:hypothetical protein
MTSLLIPIQFTPSRQGSPVLSKATANGQPAPEFINVLEAKAADV